MTVRLGGGAYAFEVNEDWAKIPPEIVLGDVAAVGVDSQDKVYAFNRGDHPVAVFDRAAICCAPGAKACSPGRTASMSRPTTRSG